MAFNDEVKVTGIGFNPNKNKNLFYQLKLDKKKLYLFDIRHHKKINNLIKKDKLNNFSFSCTTTNL